jgi:hypothetical protein
MTLQTLFCVYPVVEVCASSSSINLLAQNLFYHFTYFKDLLFYCQPIQGTHLSVHRTVPILLPQVRNIRNTGPHQCSQYILCCKSPVPIFSLLRYQNLIFVGPSNKWTCLSRQLEAKKGDKTINLEDVNHTFYCLSHIVFIYLMLSAVDTTWMKWNADNVLPWCVHIWVYIERKEYYF